MTNLCGRYIVDNFVKFKADPPLVKLADWKHALIKDFFTQMHGKGAFYGFQQNSRWYAPEFKERLLLLVTSNDYRLPYLQPIDDDIAQEGYGYVDNQQIILKCELVKQLLLRAILLPPFNPIMSTFPEPFDAVSMLKAALPHFSPSQISNSFLLSSKTARTSHGKPNSPIRLGSSVPKEAVYHVELFRILYKWIGDKENYLVINEHDIGGSRESVDIVIQNLLVNQKYSIEIAASCSDDEILKHANREYQSKVGSKYDCIIHFTPVSFYESEIHYVMGDKNLQVIHVWHDQAGKNFKIYYKEDGQVKQVDVVTAVSS